MEDFPAAQTEAPPAPSAVVSEIAVEPHPLDPLLSAFQILQMNTLRVTALVASALGIGATDLRALLFIATSDGVTPKQTGDYLELTSGSVTSLVDRMVAAGFVERLPNPNDRRSLVLRLAPDGTETVERVVGFYRRAFANSVAPHDVPKLAAAFHAIGESLTQTAADDLVRPRPR